MRFLILFGLLFSFSLTAINTNSFAQSYTTESKSCGSCNGAVSINSRVGMRCPHCGVRWGYENSSTKYSYENNYSNSYKNNYNTYPKYTSECYSSSNVNLRSQPSTNSRILKVIPRYKNVKVIKTYPSWLYVSYSFYSNYQLKTINGYVYRSYFNY